MVETNEVRHVIQKHILGVLLQQQKARFRDMRMPHTDTNLYSYHLTQLLKAGMVKKVDGGYSLDTKGLIYVDRLSVEKLFVRPQPKIVTMLIIQNGYGDILMYKKRRQPFIERWTVPNGKIHNDDISVAMAAQREVDEKIGGISISLDHVGDCYIRTTYKGEIATTMLAHVFYGQIDDFTPTGHVQWLNLRKLDKYQLAPAMNEIIARTLFRDPFFFEEFEESW